ncbi:hypothetical protein T265_06477, partial [Opisthorchis viverrini]
WILRVNFQQNCTIEDSNGNQLTDSIGITIT